MNTSQIEEQVIFAFQQALPRGVPGSRVSLASDFKLDLGVESIGLFSVIAQLEQSLNLDLFSNSTALAEARLVGDVAIVVTTLIQGQTNR